MSANTIAELDALSATDVLVAIPPDVFTPILSSPPFIPQRSLINVRDVGATPGSAILEGHIYRCGVLDDAAKDPDATAWLSNHVTRIFDLRRAFEREAAPSPVIAGVENVWYDIEGEVQHPKASDFIQDEGVTAWTVQLMAVVHAYKPTFREVLKHVRDRPTEPFLFHCTAGRDRTGVMAGMLQQLAGTSLENTVRDYMLSRIGTEPAREKLLKSILPTLGVADASTPGVADMLSLRPAFWHAFLDSLQEEYGGWDGYVTKGLGFSEEDLARIKKNLRS